MEVTCTQCSTRYLVPDDKVRGRKVRLPCRRCGNAILIDGRTADAGPKPALPPAAAQRMPAAKRTEVGGLQAPPRPTPTSDTWSVSVGGTTREMSAREIAEAFRAGTVPVSAYVWRRGMPDWVLLSDASDLADALEKHGVDVRAPESAKGLADALDDEAEATRILSSPSAASAATLSAAATDDLDDEVTRIARPVESSLGDAIGDEDEATRLYAATETASAPSSAQSPPKGALSRAEQSSAVAPKSSSAPPAMESTVVVADPASHAAPRKAKVVPAAPAKAKPAPVAGKTKPRMPAVEENMSQTRRIERPPPPPRKAPVGTILMVTVLAVSAGAAGYLLSPRGQPPVSPPQPSAESIPEASASVSKHQSVDAPLDEGPEPTLVPPPTQPVASAAPKRGTAPKRQRGAPAVAPSAPQPVAPVETEPSPSTAVAAAAFDRAAAERAMDQAARAAERSCTQPGEPNGSGIVWLSLVPTGKAVGVSLKGPLSGTTTGLCVLRSFYKVTVPAFQGEPVAMSRDVHIR